jgi:hypothetical protein
MKVKTWKKIKLLMKLKVHKSKFIVIKRFGTQVVQKNIPWRKEMEGLSEMITSNENGC